MSEVSEAGVRPEPEIASASPSPSMTDRLRLLLLCDFNRSTAGTILEHIHGIARYSRHVVHVLPMKGDLPALIDLERFDGVIIHYSLIASHDNYLSPDARARLRRYAGLKAAFIQDDYRWVNQTVEAFAYIGIDALFALAPEDTLDVVYPRSALPHVRKVTVLAGYVPEALTGLAVPPYEARAIDVGYRARKLPAWVGSHGQEKWRIGDRFLADAPRFGLRCDISWREEDRIYGEAWIEFLSNCKSVLGSESGSSVCDFTGDIQKMVEQHQRTAPDTPFEVLRDLYFKDADGKVMMNVISPRCFEAAALRTLMILYEGRYSGILLPWRHYVPLRKDHSDMDVVMATLRDNHRAQQIIDRAYREIALNPEYSFRSMVQLMDRVIDETFRPQMRPTKRAYGPNQFRWLLRRLRARELRRRTSRHLERWIVGLVFGLLAFWPAASRDRVRLALKRVWVTIRRPNGTRR